MNREKTGLGEFRQKEITLNKYSLNIGQLFLRAIKTNGIKR